MVIRFIGKSTKSDIWRRHIEDSAQIFHLAESPSKWADLGSGAGLPGLIVAILAKELSPELHTALIESDRRKASFCRTAVRELDLKADIITERIESTAAQKADVVSARALAPLYILLSHAKRHLAPGGQAIFLKGANWEKEVTESLASWRFSAETVPSKTDPSAVILKIGEIHRV